MTKDKINNGIKEVKKTAYYTIPLILLVCFISTFNKREFIAFLITGLVAAFTTQFFFGYISFDKVPLSKPKMFLFFFVFISIAILSFTCLSI